MMKPDYRVHDRQYQEARAQGWNGWGGDDRIAYEQRWVEFLFACEDVPTQGEVLELGCGEGHLSRLLAGKGYRVLGVDISPTAIQWAKEKTHGAGWEIDYLEMDLTQAGVLAGRAFDLIVDGNCLHCILQQDRKTFLANVYRLLKANGVFFVFSKCKSAGEDEIIEFEGKPYRWVPQWEHLQTELETAGFEIKKAEYHSGREGSMHGHGTIHLVRR
jgi:2-polyprenyl-3-methyl-5-hydroxy-6-metoxy-1,4-benzoquinol methylase